MVKLSLRIRKLSQGHPTNKPQSRAWKLHSLAEMSILPLRGREEVRGMPVDVARRSGERLRCGQWNGAGCQETPRILQ